MTVHHPPSGATEGTGLGTRADGVGQAAPDGYSTVTPWVISSDTARLIDFVQAAFGAHELARVPGPDGRIGHAEVRIGPGTRASSCAPNAACTKSMRRPVSLVMTHGVTVPYPSGAACPTPSALVPSPVPPVDPVGGVCSFMTSR